MNSTPSIQHTLKNFRRLKLRAYQHGVHYKPFLAYSQSHITDKLAGSIVSSTNQVVLQDNNNMQQQQQQQTTQMTWRKRERKSPRDAMTSLGPQVSVFKFLFRFLQLPTRLYYRIMIISNDNADNVCDDLDDMEKKGPQDMTTSLGHR